MAKKTISGPQFKPVVSTKTYQNIADQIKRMIFEGVFKAGDKLPAERQLAEKFNVGRMVVREGMRVLEESGFIIIKRGSRGGAFIKQADSETAIRSISNLIRLGKVSLSELSEARIAIEMLIVELAIERMTKVELKVIQENLNQTKGLFATGSATKRSNANFHLLIAKTAKNTIFEMVLASIIEIVLSIVDRASPDKQRYSKHLDYHQAIYKAIEEKNVKKAKKVLREHILDSQRRFIGIGTTKD